MLTEYAQKANTTVVCGILAQMSARSILISDLPFGIGLSEKPFVVAVGWAISILGSGLLILGCQQYAKAKGQSEWFGVLGLLSLVGLLVIAILPDKHKRKF